MFGSKRSHGNIETKISGDVRRKTLLDTIAERKNFCLTLDALEVCTSFDAEYQAIQEKLAASDRDAYKSMALLFDEPPLPASQDAWFGLDAEGRGIIEGFCCFIQIHQRSQRAITDELDFGSLYFSPKDFQFSATLFDIDRRLFSALREACTNAALRSRKPVINLILSQKFPSQFDLKTMESGKSIPISRVVITEPWNF